jgi:hypothetical protein
MHHIFTSHGLSSFFERLPHGLRTDAISVFQFDHFLGQQANGPTPSSGGRLATGQGDQVSLLVAIDLAAAMPRLGTARENSLQALLNEGLANAIDRSQADSKGRAELLIGPGRTSGGINLEQNPGAGDLAGCRFALAHQGLQALPFLLGQFHHILLVHRGCLPPGNQRNYSQCRTRRQPFNKSWARH